MSKNLQWISPPGNSSFVWRATPQNVIEFSFYEDTWIGCGAADDPDGAFSRIWNKSFEATELSWKTLRSHGIVEIKDWKRNKTAHRWEPIDVDVGNDSDKLRKSFALEDERRELRLLSLLSSATGFRLVPETWRMLSPNAVLHPSYGPCVTAATNGTHCILLSFPRLDSDHFFCSKQSVIGPVTATPVRVEDWNYGANASNFDVAKRENKARRTQSDIEGAMDLLSKLGIILPP